ncbi:unnamed protein product [Effrenium voratum]|uniref:EF-hand domain-containing protein n=1 Tax=Effrenium voratum TaxID=2562239 RepID=A0AA36J2Y2_9DINO|nr:unnamed protein product [Effrenium voratum]
MPHALKKQSYVPIRSFHMLLRRLRFPKHVQVRPCGSVQAAEALRKRPMMAFGILGLGMSATAALSKLVLYYHQPSLEDHPSWWDVWTAEHPADKVFKAADLDGDGHVDRIELWHYMMSRGIMDMSGFNAIWAEISQTESESISLQEFRHFHDNAERNFYLCLWRSLLADPTFLGSALYLSGSVLFATMPYWSLASNATMMKMGQVFYIFGGVLFLSQTLVA